MLRRKVEKRLVGTGHRPQGQATAPRQKDRRKPRQGAGWQTGWLASAEHLSKLTLLSVCVYVSLVLVMGVVL